MRILKPSADPDADLQRLAATMYNLERGALACDDALEPLPEPHRPWPLVTLPPVTDLGLPVEVHWRAAVGFVFYTTAAANFRADQFARSLQALLERLPADHLRRARPVSGTPSTLLYHAGRVADGSAVVQGDPASRRPKRLAPSLPERLLHYLDRASADAAEPPAFYSVRAGFTWVFAPAAAACGWSAGPLQQSHVNALVASALFDAAGLLRLADGAEVYRLGPGDFDLPPLPAFLADVPQAGGPTTGAEQLLRLLGAAGTQSLPGLLPGATLRALTFHAEGALVLDLASGEASYAGEYRPAANTRPLASLPELPWDPELAYRACPAAEPAVWQCAVCAAPAGGPVALVANPKTPGTGGHMWTTHALSQGEALWPPGATPQAFVMCAVCWAALDGACVAHMGAVAFRSTIPMRQAEACARTPGYEVLAPLLGGAWTPLRDADGHALRGAFEVVAPADGPDGGGALVLAGDTLGPRPALSEPALVARRLPVVPRLRLATVGRPAAAQA